MSNIGSSAITTIFDLNLLEENAKKVKNITNKKQRNKKEVVHQIYSQCAEIVEDVFWKNKFIDASINKFPKGFSHIHCKLNYRRGSKTDSVVISNNKFEVIQLFIEFMKAKGGFFSINDDDDNIDCNDSVLTWINSNVKTRSNLITNFITYKTEELNLNCMEKNDLKYIISDGIRYKIFDKNTIIVDDLRITEIKYLEWDSSMRKFSIDNRGKDLPKSKPEDTFTDEIPQKDMVPNFLTEWQKFLSMQSSKINNMNKVKSVIINHEELDEISVYDDESTTEDF
jgi:hypothetical protein